MNVGLLVGNTFLYAQTQIMMAHRLKVKELLSRLANAVDELEESQCGIGFETLLDKLQPLLMLAEE